MSNSRFKLEFSQKLDKITFETGNASIYIETKPSFPAPVKDLILSSIAASWGHDYDFEIKYFSKEKINELKRFCFEYVVPNDVKYKKDGEYGLLYSGGFDSTAAYYLLEKPKKISICFGGWFQDESKWISKIGADAIFETNIRLNSSNSREINIINRESDWKYIYFPIFWLHKSLNLAYFGTGTILEAGPRPYINKYIPTETIGLRKHGLNEFSPTRSCTEIVTTKICVIEHENEINDFITSVANQNSVKFKRKKILTNILKNTLFRTPIDVPDLEISETLTELSYTDKFLLPYIKFHLKDKMQKVYKNIDIERIPVFNEKEIRIYEKQMWDLNPDDKYKEIVKRKFSHYEIDIFDDKDIDNYNKLVAFART